MVNDIGEKMGRGGLRNKLKHFIFNLSWFGGVRNSPRCRDEGKEVKKDKKQLSENSHSKTLDQNYPKALQFRRFLQIPSLTPHGSGGYWKVEDAYLLLQEQSGSEQPHTRPAPGSTLLLVHQFPE